MREKVWEFEAGGRRYSTYRYSVPASEVAEGFYRRAEWYETPYTALRFGKPYGPSSFSVPHPMGRGFQFTSLGEAVTAAEAFATKKAPYRPSGRYAEKMGFAGKEAV